MELLASPSHRNRPCLRNGAVIGTGVIFAIFFVQFFGGSTLLSSRFAVWQP